MDPAFDVRDLAPDHVVVELHERLTCPGPPLELHVVQDSETGHTIAWWVESDDGRWLGAASVGAA